MKAKDPAPREMAEAVSEADAKIIKALTSGTWHIDPIPNSKGGATPMKMTFSDSGALKYVHGFEEKEYSEKYSVKMGVLTYSFSGGSYEWKVQIVNERTITLSKTLGNNKEITRTWRRK